MPLRIVFVALLLLLRGAVAQAAADPQPPDQPTQSAVTPAAPEVSPLPAEDPLDGDVGHVFDDDAVLLPVAARAALWPPRHRRPPPALALVSSQCSRTGLFRPPRPPRR